jgi:FkbM family methyltransferase
LEVHPYRWRVSGSLLAHLWKAATQQHHRALAPTLTRLLPHDAVVFDVGAHAGQYTKLFARAAANGRVYAFEPGSYARSILRAVIWLRRLANVTAIPLALGSVAQVNTLTIPLKQSGSFGFGLSHLGGPQQRWSAVSQEIVGLTTVDEIVAALGLDRLDFIKADVEGWEPQMLHGAHMALDRFRPHLLLELTSEGLARAGDRLEDAFAFLTTRNYRAFTVAAAGTLAPVETPCDGDFWFVPVDHPFASS